MKRSVVNTFRTQVIKDSDFVGLAHDSLTSFALVTTYVLKAKAKYEGIKYMSEISKAKDMAPYFNEYLMEAEKALGKPRESFTDKEREQCTNEFLEIFEGATKMLETYGF